MTANGAPVEANSCIASLGEPLDAGDFHHLAAAARRPLISVEPGTSRRSNIDIGISNAGIRASTYRSLTMTLI
jgi:hypothetical protein